MPDIAELGLSIDTRQLEQGAQAMDRLGAASESVEKKVDSATTAIDKLGKASADAKGKTAEGAAAVDAVGEAGARVVPKVDAATASIDAMGATAARIRTVFLGGSNTLDGFMGSSMGVWRSSEAAAAGIDSLGNATERTWKKQADYNGAMADTTRIMRQAADAARTLEESNHRMLIELQREIDTFGMARGELERYRAAELGLGSAAQTKAAALGNSIDAMHREERAARDAAGAQDRAAAAGDRFIKTLQDQVATLGMTTQQLQTYRAAQLGVSDAAAPLINKLAETGEGAKKAGGHMEGFSFQSASAKRELLVLAHELSQGQFQRFGGSMMVLGEQTGAAGLLFSSTGLAVLGFAAALGTVAYAMIKGASEQREMNNALISTNNYAGVTSDKLNELAHAATAAHGSIGEAKKVVTELTGTGKFTGDQIAYITDAVIALEYATGTSVKKTIKEFESLAVQSTGSTNRATEVITRATVKLDDTYHFLTLSVYEQIRALEKDGDAKAASAVATAEFARATKDGADQMIENLGSVAKAWHGVTEAVGKAMDAIGEYGKKDTPGRDVKAYSGWLADLDTKMAIENKQYGRAADFPIPAFQEKRTEVVLKLVDAVDRLNQADAAAIAQGKTVENNSRAVHAAAMIHAEDIRMQKKGMSELAVALDAYKQNREAIRAVDPDSPLLTPEAVAAGIAARTKAHTEQSKPKANQADNTQLAAQIQGYEREAAEAKRKYDALGKLDDLYLRAGELSAEQAYENKRAYAAATYQAEVDAYQSELTALAKHKNATNAEEEKHRKESEAILGKLNAAEKSFFADREYRDEEERVRKDALAASSNDAMNKYISSINQEAQKIEEANRGREVSRGSIEREAVAQLDLAIAYQKQFMAGQAAAGATDAELAQAPAILKYLEDQRAARARLAQGLDAQSDAKHMENLANQAVKDWDRAGKSIADSLSTAFGNGGKAIGQMFKAYSEGVAGQLRSQKELREARKLSDDNPDRIAAINRAQLSGATAQIKSYADMTTAAQGFFSEGSRGYQAMAAASQVMHAAEVALTVVKGINAVLTQGEGDPYTAFGRMAAMAAVVTALGVAIGGVSGGPDTTAKDRQAANGTGSVLGDSSAKSESIAHSLAIMEKNSGLGLAYSASMASSLRQVVAGIGGLGGLLVRNAGVTGSVAPDSYGAAQNLFNSTLGKIPLIGGILGKVGGGVLGSIFGGKTTTLDTGLTLSKATLDSIAGRGVSSSQYTDTKTSGGWFSSDKNSTALNGLGPEANDQFTKIILGLRDTVQSSATALGIGGEAFNAKLNTFVVDLGKISLKDLSGEEQQKALETAFSKLGDDMAKFGVAGLQQYQAVGEGYLETLVRVTNDYMQVSDVLAVLGKSFNTTGLGAVALSESLITAAGGLEALTGGTSYFVENFLTEAERMAPITKSVNDAMGKLGVSGVTTVDQFKQLVLAQDLNTAAGQAMYAQLIALAEPFKTVADYAAELAGGLADVAKTASEVASERKDLQSQLDQLTLSALQLRAKEREAIDASNRALFDQVAARQDLATAYETESKAITSTVDKLTTFAGAIKTFRDGLVLGGLSTLSPTEKAAEAQRQYSDMLAAARAGDATAQTGLTGAASAYLTASQAASGTAAQYARDYARVQADMAIMAANVGSQLTAAQAQQIALDKQVSGLITLNDSVKAGAATVAQAIASLGVLGVRQIVSADASSPSSLQGGYVAGGAASAPIEPRNFTPQSSVDSQALVDEIKGLRADNRALKEELTSFKTQSQAENVAIVQSVGKLARLADRWDANGIPTREVA